MEGFAEGDANGDTDGAGEIVCALVRAAERRNSTVQQIMGQFIMVRVVSTYFLISHDLTITTCGTSKGLICGSHVRC